MILECHKCKSKMIEYSYSTEVIQFQCQYYCLICNLKNNNIIFYTAGYSLDNKEYNLSASIKDKSTQLADAYGDILIQVPYYIQPIIKTNSLLIDPIFNKLRNLLIFK